MDHHESVWVHLLVAHLVKLFWINTEAHLLVRLDEIEYVVVLVQVSLVQLLQQLRECLFVLNEFPLQAALHRESLFFVVLGRKYHASEKFGLAQCVIDIAVRELLIG